MREHWPCLKDILGAIEAIERFVEGVDFEAFREDDMRSSAVIRKFEIIGEAAKNVPGDVKERNPSIPWKAHSEVQEKEGYKKYPELLRYHICEELTHIFDVSRDVIEIRATVESPPR